MKCKCLILFIVAALAALLCPPLASAAPILGTDLASFAVLGASTVTNVPTSTIVGNVGVWSSGGANAITGFGDTTQVTGGTLQAGTALAEAAQGELTTARTNLGLLGPGTPLPVDLTGLTIFPGVYTVAAGTTNLSGAVTLDGLGNLNALWVFQMPSTLITSPNSVVNVINTGVGAGLFWNVGSSATLDTTTTFQGNILALTSITLNNSAKILNGRALADTGAVTMDTNTISNICYYDNGFPPTGIPIPGSTGLSGSGLDFRLGTGGTGVVVVTSSGEVVSVPGPAPVPEPSTLLLLGSGLVGLVAFRKRFKKA